MTLSLTATRTTPTAFSGRQNRTKCLTRYMLRCVSALGTGASPPESPRGRKTPQSWQIGLHRPWVFSIRWPAFESRAPNGRWTSFSLSWGRVPSTTAAASSPTDRPHECYHASDGGRPSGSPGSADFSNLNFPPLLSRSPPMTSWKSPKTLCLPCYISHLCLQLHRFNLEAEYTTTDPWQVI